MCLCNPSNEKYENKCSHLYKTGISNTCLCCGKIVPEESVSPKEPEIKIPSKVMVFVEDKNVDEFARIYEKINEVIDCLSALKQQLNEICVELPCSKGFDIEDALSKKEKYD